MLFPPNSDVRGALTGPTSAYSSFSLRVTLANPKEPAFVVINVSFSFEYEPPTLVANPNSRFISSSQLLECEKEMPVSNASDHDVELSLSLWCSERRGGAVLRFKLNEGGSVTIMDVGSIEGDIIVVDVGAFRDETLTESLGMPAELWSISSNPRGDPGGGGGLVGGAGGPDELENSIESNPRGDPGGGGGLVGCAGGPFAFKDELEDFADIEPECAEAEADVAVEVEELLYWC